MSSFRLVNTIWTGAQISADKKMTKPKEFEVLTLAELELHIKILENKEANEFIAIPSVKIDGPLSIETVEALARIFEKRNVTVRLSLSVTTYKL